MYLHQISDVRAREGTFATIIDLKATSPKFLSNLINCYFTVLFSNRVWGDASDLKDEDDEGSTE